MVAPAIRVPEIRRYIAAVRSRLRPEVVVATVYVAAMFMNIMDVTVVNVVIPTLGRQFHAANSSIEWVVTGYLLSLAIWIPASGWIGDRFGTKRTFLLAIAVFALGSALCGASQSLGQLVAARILQGVGGGMMTPVGHAMLFRAFPPERRARAAQVLIIPTVVAPTLGPILGGFSVEQLSWRWAFLINVPIAVVAILFGLVMLPEHREPAAGRLDLRGFVLSGAGLALVLYSISRGPGAGWGSPEVLLTGLAGLTLGTVMVRVELGHPAPMLDLRLLGDRLFRQCNLVAGISFAAFLGSLFLMPLFLQQARGLSALQSGLSTFPEALGVAVSTQLVGRLYIRVGPRRLMMTGLTSLMVVVGLMSTLQLGTSLWAVRALMFGAGASMAFVIIPQQAATFATIRPALMGRATAIFNSQRQMSGALGVAILATVLTLSGGSTPGTAHAFQTTFLVAAGMAALGILVAARVPDADAAATRGLTAAGEVAELTESAELLPAVE